MKAELGSELYDHENDPRELTNLATDSVQAKVVAEMKGLLKKSEH